MLLTLASLKTELAITTAASDTQLTNLITGVGVRFGVFCDRNLERAASQTEDHDAKPSIMLRRYPVESLALYYDTLRSFGASTLLVSDTDYVLNTATGLVRMLTNLSPWPLGLRATVTGGYVSAGSSPSAGQTAIPDDITRAMLQQCVFEWRNKAEFGRSNVSLQGGSIGLAEYNLLPDVANTLNAYKRISL